VKPKNQTRTPARTRRARTTAKTAHATQQHPQPRLFSASLVAGGSNCQTGTGLAKSASASLSDSLEYVVGFFLAF